MALHIHSNYHWRDFLHREDVPESVLSGYLDWCDESWGYLKYRGEYFHLSQFMVSGPTLTDAGWQAAEFDGYGCGTCISISEDGSTYRIGRFHFTAE